MARGRPKGDEPTCVFETRVGLKASRNEIIRHALRQFLEAEQHDGRARPPPHVPAL